MLWLAKIISTGLGIGYVKKGGGTLAALFTCAFLLMLDEQEPNLFIFGAVLLIVFFAGVWSAGEVEQVWGPDPAKVVIDEIFGMGLAMFLLPLKWQYILPSLILFRFFDIRKPLLIRKAEDLPGGWGVMADDLLAGLYSNLLMQLVVKTNLW
jgi:phosphatidylglycerophosphatase A